MKWCYRCGKHAEIESVEGVEQTNDYCLTCKNPIDLSEIELGLDNICKHCNDVFLVKHINEKGYCDSCEGLRCEECDKIFNEKDYREKDCDGDFNHNFCQCKESGDPAKECYDEIANQGCML